MKRVLDVGCGAGNLLNYLAKRDKKTVFSGVDIGRDIIKRANKNKYCNRENFVLMDAENLPFQDDFFDEVYCYEVLEHVEDLDKVLSEIKRVLKQAGKLKVTVPLKKSEKILIKYNKNYPRQVGHRRFFSEEDIEKILKRKKFRIDSHKTSNAIEHLFWESVFKNGGDIINQLGEADKRPGKIMRVSSLAFSRELSYNRDQTKNKYYKFIMSFFVLFYPIAIMLDSVLTNKKQRVVCTNGK